MNPVAETKPEVNFVQETHLTPVFLTIKNDVKAVITFDDVELDEFLDPGLNAMALSTFGNTD